MGDGIRVEPVETELNGAFLLVVVLQARTWAEEGRWRRITTAQPATIMIACRIALPKEEWSKSIVRRRLFDDDTTCSWSVLLASRS